MAWKVFRLNAFICSFLWTLCSAVVAVSSCVPWHLRMLGKKNEQEKLPLLGGARRERKKYLLHSKISHNNGSSHQIIARVRMDKHLSYSSLAILTKIWYPVREITDHPGLFWQLWTLVFFTLDRTFQYFIASVSLVPGSQFMCFCDFELFLSWVYQQTAAPEQICLRVGSKWQLAAQSFHFLLHCSGIHAHSLSSSFASCVHLTWPFIVQMFYFDIDLLIQRAD